MSSMFAICGIGFGFATASCLYCGDENFYRLVAMPTAAKLLDAESAHEWSIWLAAKGFLPRCAKTAANDNAMLATRVFGLNFRHPVGLAAGFDKHGEAAEALLDRLGFSHVEVGTVTPLPQPGNAKPRVFRLPADQAVINRYGFNSHGQQAVVERLHTLRRRQAVKGIVGVNVGKNKEATDAVGDFVAGVETFGGVADYLVVNISSPNTPGLRRLQQREQLTALLTKVIAARNALGKQHRPPLLVKIAPDLSLDELETVCAVILQPATRVDGVIVGNTTVARDDSLVSDPKLTAEAGGLSGAPLRGRATEMIRHTFRLTGGQMPIVGVGGVSSGADAVKKMRAGASLVQIYSAMAFQGPPVVERIVREMEEELRRQKVDNVRQIVGSEAKE